MITSADLVGKFQFALDNDWGYIWGTAGVEWTAAKQAQLEKTTDENRAMSRKYGKKWIGHWVADCSGLFVWAFKQFGMSMSHISSNIYKSYCTSTKGRLTSELKQTIRAGSAVFTGDKPGNHPHVGLYVGNNTVIEAKGTINGVVTSNLTDKKWTFYGELKDVSYDGEVPAPTPTPEPTPGTTKPTLRRGSKGSYVIELQTALQTLGYGLGPGGIDGDYGRSTQAAVETFQYDRKIGIDGICGPKTWAEIDKALKEKTNAPAPVIKYTVVIKGLSLDEADSLVMKYPNAVASAEGSDR